MAYDPILPGEITQDQPVDPPLMTKIKGNFEYLYSKAYGNSGLLNGSYEVDSDGDGIPDNWTRELYPGGSGGMETTSPDHGAKGYWFIHPGGAGNGGGNLKSDYFEWDEKRKFAIIWLMHCTAAGMKCIVNALWYKKDKTPCTTASTTLYSSTANPTACTKKSAQATPPADCRFVKIQLIGGYTDTDVAGTAYFDGVSLDEVVIEDRIAAGAVNQPALKTSTGNVSGTINASAGIVFALQDYCFAPNLYIESPGVMLTGYYTSNPSDTVCRGGAYNPTAFAYDYDIDYRYITATDEPFIFAIRDKQTGEIKHVWIGDDPPPGFWGLDEPPKDFVWPVKPSGGTENLEPLIRFKLPEDFLPELRGRQQKDKKHIYQILNDHFDWNPAKKLFVPRAAGL